MYKECALGDLGTMGCWGLQACLLCLSPVSVVDTGLRQSRLTGANYLGPVT